MSLLLFEFSEEIEPIEEAEPNPLVLDAPVPELLRYIRQSKWDVNRDEPLADKLWLAPGDLQADVFSDLRTTSNSLSVWQIEKDDKPCLDRIIAALAARRKEIAVFEYAIVDVRAVEELGISISKQPGDTFDDDANDRWHYDLVELTANRLLELAKLISQRNEMTRLSRTKVKELITASVEKKYLDWHKLSEKMQKDIPKP